MNNNDPQTIADNIQRSLKWLMIATVGVYVALILIIGYTYWTSSTNRNALCSLRADVEIRVESSEQFLKDNPKGIPGLPAASIQQSIDNSKRTINALSGLNC